ncbi:CpaF family protein [Methylophaga pinxianii]|uniref:CpaF family protein n=1 Tax=Methylophaga pinxianii TaxID=2881052 RepID=UPI002551F9DC|nr:CpaF family protein [Methylophaga pinxianii]
MAFQYPQYDFSLKSTQTYQDIKYALHRYLIARVEEDKIPIVEWSEEQLNDYVYGHVTKYAHKSQMAVSSQDLDDLTEEMVNELVGYGPLHSLLEDDNISDIMVNGAHHIFIEKQGKVQKSSLRFIDDEHVLRVIRRIIAPMGRRLDESSPMVDARLPNGSRINAIIPPLALDGPCISIRKFRQEMLRETDMLVYGTLDQDMLDLLVQAVKSRCNIMVSGGTGTGKTTLLNTLSRFIDPAQRIVTIEDAAELQLGHHHVVRLETRPPTIEGEGEVKSRDLVRNALRMRPDRIILGEVRGEEVLDVLQAMNTGHDGSMSTVHANNPRDALVRLEMLASLANFKGAHEVIREMIASAVDLLVHISRFADGTRRITSIAEITGHRDGQYMLNELFSYNDLLNKHEKNSVRPVNEKFLTGSQLNKSITHRSSAAELK